MKQVYLVTNLVNGKIYIGQTNGKRWRYYGGGKIIKQAIRKYGKYNFRKSLLIEGLYSQEEIDELEILFIKQYNSCDKTIGYNILPGGFGGRNIIITEETRRKMSASAIGKKKGPQSEEHRRNLSISHIGLVHPSTRKAVMVYDINRRLLFECQSVTEAALKTNNCDSNISAACKGRKGQLKGYIFEYKSQC